MIGGSSQQMVFLGRAATQCMEENSASSEIDFTTNESMRPDVGYGEALAEKMDSTCLIGAAQVDDRAVERGIQIELEALGEWPALGSLLAARGAASAVCADVAIGELAQLGQVFEPVALPKLGLPKRVKALDRVLKAWFARWGEHYDHAQGQAQPTDAANGVGVLVRPLEQRVVIELRVVGQPVATPALYQALQHCLGTGRIQRPDIGQPAVQRGAGEDRDQRAVGNLQILNQVKAVQLGVACGQCGEIPTLRGWRASNSTEIGRA